MASETNEKYGADVCWPLGAFVPPSPAGQPVWFALAPAAGVWSYTQRVPLGSGLQDAHCGFCLPLGHWLDLTKGRRDGNLDRASRQPQICRQIFLPFKYLQTWLNYGIMR